jgi:hypothetical protein
VQELPTANGIGPALGSIILDCIRWSFGSGRDTYWALLMLLMYHEKDDITLDQLNVAKNRGGGISMKDSQFNRRRENSAR